MFNSFIIAYVYCMESPYRILNITSLKGKQELRVARLKKTCFSLGVLWVQFKFINLGVRLLIICIFALKVSVFLANAALQVMSHS